MFFPPAGNPENRCWWLFRLHWPPDLVGLYNKPQVFFIKFWNDPIIEMIAHNYVKAGLWALFVSVGL